MNVAGQLLNQRRRYNKMGYTKEEQELRKLIALTLYHCDCGISRCDAIADTLMAIPEIKAAPRMVDTLLMVREELCFGGDWETTRNKINEVLKDIV